MIEQERIHLTTDQNNDSRTANPAREFHGIYPLKIKSFANKGITYTAEIARNEQGLIVRLENMRPENGQEIPQNPKRIVRRSRFC